MLVHVTQNLDRVGQARGWARWLVGRAQTEHQLPAREAARVVARRLKTTASEIMRLARGEISDLKTRTFFALNEAVERDLRNGIKRMESDLAAVVDGRRHLDPAALAAALADLESARAWMNGSAAPGERGH